MRHYSDIVLQSSGRPASGASVAVYAKGTVTPATIYSDDGVTTRGNPVTTDAFGRFDFYVADGRYDLAVSGTGITPYTVSDVEILSSTAGAFTVGYDYPTIQGAIDAASSNYTVYVPAGAYSISTTLSVAGKSNFQLVFDRGAVLTAQSGLGSSPMLDVTGASTDVRIEGGLWNGNSISTVPNAIRVVSGATAGASPQRVWVQNTEIKNLNSASAFAIYFKHDGTTSHAHLSSGAFVEGNYIHDIGGKAFACSSWNDVRFSRNYVDNCDLGGTGQEIVSVGTAVGAIISNNIILNVPGNVFTNRVGGFAVSDFVISDNYVTRKPGSGTAGSAIYVDTGINGVIANNIIIENAVNDGITIEVSHNVTISGNSVFGARNHSIWIHGRQDPVQRNSLDATTGLTANTNVTLSTDAGDKQEGTGSLQAVVAAGFTTGFLFYENFSGIDWTQKPVSDGNARNCIDLWIKSDVAIGSGVLQFQASSAASLATVVWSANIPQIPAATWRQIRLIAPKWYPELTSIQSWGIVALSDPGAVTLHFDDLRTATTAESNSILNNTITQGGFNGLEVLNNSDVLVAGNIIRDMGWNTTGTPNGIKIDCADTGAALNPGTLSKVVVANNLLRPGSVVSSAAGTNNGILIQQSGSGTVDDVRVLNNDFQGFTTSIAVSGTLTNIYEHGNQTSEAFSHFFRVKARSDNTSTLTIDSGSTAAQTAGIQFADRNSPKWQLQKESSSNSLQTFDSTNQITRQIFTTTTANSDARLNALGTGKVKFNIDVPVSGTNYASALGIDVYNGGASPAVVASIDGGGDYILTTANTSTWRRGSISELITLSTSGATTDSAANLLPANSIIEGVTARITTTITTATDWKLGDATQAARFTAANATLTAGTTTVGLNHADPTVATANLGPVQTAAAKLRITTTGTPGAGAIRVTVFYRQFVAPTS